MKKIMLLFISILTMIFVFSLTYDFSFEQSDLTITKIGEYDFLQLKNCDYIHETGNPELPLKSFSFSIPYNAHITNVYIDNTNIQKINGTYSIYPAQKAVPISYKINNDFQINNIIYSTNEIYPNNPIISYSTGSIAGYKIVNVLLSPIQYNPVTEEIYLINNGTIHIEYDFQSPKTNIPYLPEDQAIKRISNIVLNDYDINKNAPIRNAFNKGILLDSDTIEYVIITSSTFDTIFERLAEWKTQKGTPACVVTTDWIYANYSGTDHAEQVRNFIIDANSTWNTIYVLLGGQCDYENNEEIVPRRDVYYTSSGAGYYSDEDTIPSDLYYSDLDGDWNADGDAIWGEKYDNVDLYSDIYVGRAPVKTIEQAQGFVNKVFTYEKTPYYGYEKKLMLSSGVLWDTYEGDTIYQNTIANMVPADWTVTKLYEKYGNLSHTAFIDSIEKGYGLGHLVGHGNEYAIYTTNASYWNYVDADTMTNMPKVGIFNSIACFVGALDEVQNGDSYAELLVNNPNGGAYATIMNTRYGWGYPPSIGPSEIIDTNFYHDIYKNNEYILGQVHAYSKDAYVPYASWNSIEVWCIYELTLFGDPETDIWTDNPDTMTISCDDSIPIGSYSMTLNITDKNTGTPLDNAKVCISDPSQSIYYTGYTNTSGNVTITVSSSFPETLLIIATKHNYIPTETNTYIFVPDKFVGYYSNAIIDTAGNNNSILDAGETAVLHILNKNFGPDTAYSVICKLYSTDPNITILTDSVILGDIAGNDSVYADFNIQIANNISDYYNTSFQVECTDINDTTWNTSFSIQARHFSILSGSVKANTGNNPLANTILELIGTETFIDTTDSNGLFNISNIPGDDYTLIIDNPDYLPDTQLFTFPSDTNINVLLVRPVKDIDKDSIQMILGIDSVKTDTIMLYNNGDADMDFTISTQIGKFGTSKAFFTISPTEGTISPNDSATILVIVDATGRTTATYNFSIVISTNDPVSADTTIPTTIEVVDYSNIESKNIYFVPEIIKINSISRNSVNIYSSSMKDNKLNIEIFDISGRIIYRTSFNYNNKYINKDIRLSTNGIYFIKAYNNNTQLMKKIILIK